MVLILDKSNFLGTVFVRLFVNTIGFMMTNDLRVMIVDDSIAFRRMLANVINSLPGVVVVGNASNGKQALGKFSEIEPDIVTLEVEMTFLNSIETLRRLQEKTPS